MIKKAITIFFTVLLVLSLWGCGNKEAKPLKETEPAKSEPQKVMTAVDRIKQAGKLVMATSADYPPFESMDPGDGKTIIGFDVDIASKLAQSLGVKLEVQNIDFNGLLPALVEKKADIVIAGMSVTPERQQSVDFSKVYFTDKQVLVVNAGNDSIKTAPDMSGKNIGAQIGSTCLSAAEQIPGAKIKQMSKVNQLLLEIKNKRLDGVVVNLASASEYVGQMDGLKMVDIPELNNNPEGYAIAVPKGNAELVDAINSVVGQLNSSGEYKQLEQKWFKTN
jgi:polar amino acid transport system substrate-binding protein